MDQEQHNTEWLSHLSSEIVADARGPELDAYVLALEGWRRGLTLRWHTKDSEKFKEMKTWFVDKPGKLFSLSSKDKTHYFFRTRGDLVTNESVEIGMDKDETKQYLTKANVPMPKGESFDETTNDETILAYAEEVGFPVVIKPTDGSFGRGVITNIQGREELADHITYVRQELGYRNVIIEQYIPGNEYRLYVVENKVVAAMNRVPANVIGDGVHTIKELIEQKNKEKEKNPRLISCLIKLNKPMREHIRTQGYKPKSVLADGQQLLLSDISNISTGGDPISVTGQLPEAVCDTAVKALTTIPGLAHGAVDLIIDERKSIEDAATVLELNPTSQIGGLLFPAMGQANDVPSAIIDYYFPETTEKTTDHSKLYFDFTDVLYPLNTQAAKSTLVTPYPKGKIYAKRYTLTGDVQNIGFHRGLRKQAFERQLSGLIVNLESGDVDVVVAGTDQEMVDDYEHALWEDPERSEIHEVHISEWDGPIKIGFEIKADLKLQLEELEQLKKETEQTEIELKQAEKQYKQLQHSMSWRVTSPIRLAGAVAKKMKRNK